MNFRFYTTTEDLKAWFGPSFFGSCLDFIQASPSDAEVNRGFVIQFSGPKSDFPSETVIIPVFEKTFHLPQAICFSFLSPSDLHTQEN